MRKLIKSIYIIRLLLLVINFYFVFNMLNNILDTKIYGIIFIIMYLVYVIKIVSELISRKKEYQDDPIYNFMQIGFMAYLLIISIKTNAAKIYVTKITLSYFQTNYIVLSILIVFILVYGTIGSINKST